MTYDNKKYLVRLNMPDGTARFLVHTYNMDHARKIVGLEFKRIVWTINDTAIKEPPIGEPFSFQQELRLCSEAAETYTGPRTDEGGFIKKLLRQAYKEDAVVEVTEITNKSFERGK